MSLATPLRNKDYLDPHLWFQQLPEEEEVCDRGVDEVGVLPGDIHQVQPLPTTSPSHKYETNTGFYILPIPFIQNDIPPSIVNISRFSTVFPPLPP